MVAVMENVIGWDSTDMTQHLLQPKSKLRKLRFRRLTLSFETLDIQTIDCLSQNQNVFRRRLPQLCCPLCSQSQRSLCHQACSYR